MKFEPHNRTNTASIYRHRKDLGHVASHDLQGIIAPHYRGFKLACLASEVEAAKRKVDTYWDARYQAEATPAGRVAVLMEVRAMRSEPKNWTA